MRDSWASTNLYRSLCPETGLRLRHFLSGLRRSGLCKNWSAEVAMPPSNTPGEVERAMLLESTRWPSSVGRAVLEVILALVSGQVTD